MPEALAAVPLLQMPAENSSEIGDSSTAAEETTDRSTDSRTNHHPQVVKVSEKRHAMKSQVKNKLRKSNGRRSVKKTQLRPLTAEKKATSLARYKSHIPRARDLTRSPSTTSLSTNNSSPSPSTTEEKQLQTTSSNISCLVRQKTAVILAFRQRKSFSQMDFCQARRFNHHARDNCESNKAWGPNHCVENIMIPNSKNSITNKMYNQDYYSSAPAPDPQTAGMRIFAIIMLNAWRKRRDEVRRLRDEVVDLKRMATKAKNQLHVFNSLFRVEQKRNDELNFHLKKSLDNVNLTKTSCENLTTSLISLKADKALLEQQLQTKDHEIESIYALLSQTQSDLFKSVTVQRELQAALSMEQRKVQSLENQKNELINEICELNTGALEKEDILRREIQEKSEEFFSLKLKLGATEEEVITLKQSTVQLLSESRSREERMRQEVESMESELKDVHQCLEKTIGNRLKNQWNNAVSYQKATLQMLHWLMYCTIPATPAPKMKTFPFAFSLDKVLSIVKR